MNKIEISNLNLHYGNFHALKNINLDIQEKEITAFIGPSGCGKSTLLKSINRMNDLVEGCRIDGEILLDGIDGINVHTGRMDADEMLCFFKENRYDYTWDEIALIAFDFVLIFALLIASYIISVRIRKALIERRLTTD